jgi:hypothetical protein
MVESQYYCIVNQTARLVASPHGLTDNPKNRNMPSFAYPAE